AAGPDLVQAPSPASPGARPAAFRRRRVPMPLPRATATSSGRSVFQMPDGEIALQNTRNVMKRSLYFLLQFQATQIGGAGGAPFLPGRDPAFKTVAELYRGRSDF